MGHQGARSSSDRPLRTCIGCRRRSQQRRLTRFALAGDAIVVDSDRRLPGRGAYLCERASCATLVLKDGRRLARALRATDEDVTVDVQALQQDHRSDQDARRHGSASDTRAGRGRCEDDDPGAA